MGNDDDKKNKMDFASILKKFTQKDKKLFIKLGIILICGIVLMSLGKSSSTQVLSSSEIDSVTETQSNTSISSDYYSEEHAIENKLSTILSNVKGAGSVSVAISFEEGTESIYAEESNESISPDQTEISISLAEINENPVLLKQKLPQIRGVVIVAQGAGDPIVKERLYQATSSLLGLTSTQIAIIEGNPAN